MNPVRWLIGPMLSRIVMPAQTRKDEQKFQDIRARTRQDGVHIKHEQIDSTGGASIDVATFQKNPRGKAQRVIVFAVGNGHGYEDKFDKLVYMAKKYPNAQVVAFNFRNVLASKGVVYHEQDWIDDAKAVAKHIQSQGFANEHILFNGFSLGGAITTMMIAQLYQEERAAAKPEERDNVKAIRLINQRSLASLVDVLIESTLKQNICATFNVFAYGLMAAGLFAAASAGFGLGIAPMMLGLYGAASGLVTGLFSMLHPRVCFALARPFAYMAGVLTVGRIDALSAYLSLPDDAKDHIVAKHDSKIPASISLHQGLKHNIHHKRTLAWREQRQLLEQQKKEKVGSPAYTALAEQIDALDQVFKELKDCKIKHVKHTKNGHYAHNDPLEYFVTYNRYRDQQITGQELLEHKIERMLDIKPGLSR